MMPAQKDHTILGDHNNVQFTMEQVRAMLQDCIRIASQHVRDNRLDVLRNDYWMTKTEAMDLLERLDGMQELFYTDILNCMFADAKNVVDE